MAKYLVCRHQGAIEWFNEQGYGTFEVVQHLDVGVIKSGDTVVGVLPVQLACEVCAKQAQYFNLSIDCPIDMRGKELTKAQMYEFNARLEIYHVTRG